MKLLTPFVVAVCVHATAAAAQSARPVRGLTPFGSDRALRDYFAPLHAAYRRDQEERERQRLEGYKTLPPCHNTNPIRSTTADGTTVLSGIVRDLPSQPLAGASVAISSLSLATTTGVDGTYRLTIPNDSLTSPRQLMFLTRLLGYRPRHDTVTISRGESIQNDVVMCPAAVMFESMVTTGTASALKDESITNTQHEGVDEGGIVKLHRNYLIVLRRGRLFTIDVSRRRLRRVSTVDAYPPDVDASGDWYDELLTYEDRVIVIGYSYSRRGTEINMFRIDDRGRLSYESSHQLRSADYYSADNYASRLIGNKLVFYTPVPVSLATDDIVSVLPAMRQWDGSEDGGRFRRIAPANRIYRAPMDFRVEHHLTMHTITSCDLDRPLLDCEATVVIGPAGREFSVSPTAVYAWLSEWRDPSDSNTIRSFVYRMPLDGSPPTALGAHGSPIDQFSFLESDGYLNVVVRWDASGNALWSSRVRRSDVALLRVPLSQFGDGRSIATIDAYRLLPQPPTSRYPRFTNRFVEQHLIYGTGNGWGIPRGADSPVFIVPLHGGPVTSVRLSHGVDRIEPMGGDAVVIGSDSVDLHVSGISMDGRPHLRQRFVLREASQGETRSHGFFYTPDSDGHDRGGVLGLPVQGAGVPGYEHLFQASAAILFARNTGDRFERLGTLDAKSTDVIDDECESSCIDWYGNSRPLFLGGRTFALLGYELVEGRLTRDRIREVRRLNFAP